MAIVRKDRLITDWLKVLPNKDQRLIKRRISREGLSLNRTTDSLVLALCCCCDWGNQTILSQRLSRFFSLAMSASACDVEVTKMTYGKYWPNKNARIRKPTF